MMARHEALGLLTEPSECLRVLEYLAEHPRAAPVASCQQLHISLRTWYASIKRLDDLGLILVERAPGGTKIRRIEVAPLGHAVMRLLEGLPALLSESAPALRNEVQRLQSPTGAPRTAQALCKLIENAQRKADFEDLRDIMRRARGANRYGEAALALAVEDFLRGEMTGAASRCESALRLLEGEGNSPSFRHALALQAAALSALGETKGAYEAFSRLRGLAREAKDPAGEADARLGIGLLKASRGQFSDALAHLEKALECARRAPASFMEAKVLSASSLVSFIGDPAAGLERCEEALAAARRSGARAIEAQIHANKALMLAAAGRESDSLEQMAAAADVAGKDGRAGSVARLDPWGALVRQMLRQKPTHGASRGEIIPTSTRPPARGPDGQLRAHLPAAAAR